MGGMAEGLPAGAGQVPAAAEPLPHAARLQILATEHWSLLATRSLSWSEAFSRSAMFLSALSGAVVALALVSQTMAGQGFVIFSLLLLPVVLFLGLATFARLVAINNEDAYWVMGMNRLRRAYMELAPDLEQYFISGTYDDVAGVMQTFAATSGPGTFLHIFVTTPGMIAMVDGMIAGVLATVVVGALVSAPVEIVVAVGAVAFIATVCALLIYQFRAQTSFANNLKPRFPRPATSGAVGRRSAGGRARTAAKAARAIEVSTGIAALAARGGSTHSNIGSGSPSRA